MVICTKQHVSNIFKAQFMEKLSNTEAELKKNKKQKTLLIKRKCGQHIFALCFPFPIAIITQRQKQSPRGVL